METLQPVRACFRCGILAECPKVRTVPPAPSNDQIPIVTVEVDLCIQCDGVYLSYPEWFWQTWSESTT
jgi:hypothetical protein